MTETLQNAGHLFAARFQTPFVVDPRNLAGRVRVFDQLDFRFAVSHELQLPLQYLAI